MHTWLTVELGVVKQALPSWEAVDHVVIKLVPIMALHACRAYKLGKRRWSYNQFELVLLQDGVDSAHVRSLAVMEATHCKEASADEGCLIGQVMPGSKLCYA